MEPESKLGCLPLKHEADSRVDSSDWYKKCVKKIKNQWLWAAGIEAPLGKA